MFGKNRPLSELDSLLRQADTARDGKDWFTAAGAYEAYLNLSPDEHAIWVQLGNCAKEAGNYKLSLSAYETALSLNGQFADTHLQLGHLYKLMGRSGSAISHYQQALQIDPSLSDAQNELSAISHHVQDKPFLLTGTYLDFIKARSLEDLMTQRQSYDDAEDPFRQFLSLVTE